MADTWHSLPHRDSSASFLRAYCYAKIGCFPQSVNDYNCVLDIDPHNSHAMYNRCG